MLLHPDFTRALVDHYKPLEEYQNRKELAVYDGAWEEDHFCIRYFCRGLEGYIKSYQKKYYGLYNVNSHGAITYGRCACGNLFLQNKRRNRRLCSVSLAYSCQSKSMVFLAQFSFIILARFMASSSFKVSSCGERVQEASFVRQEDCHCRYRRNRLLSASSPVCLPQKPGKYLQPMLPFAAATLPLSQKAGILPA